MIKKGEKRYISQNDTRAMLMSIFVLSIACINLAILFSFLTSKYFLSVIINGKTPVILPDTDLERRFDFSFTSSLEYKSIIYRSYDILWLWKSMSSFLYHLVCTQSIINEPTQKYLKLISEGKNKKKHWRKKTHTSLHTSEILTVKQKPMLPHL